MGLNYSNEYQYLQEINCSYILHDCLAILNSSSTSFIALILYFCFSKKCGVTFLARCSTQTPPLSDGQHVAKSSLDVMLKEKNSLQSSPWGIKTLSSSWPIDLSVVVSNNRTPRHSSQARLGVRYRTHSVSV